MANKVDENGHRLLNKVSYRAAIEWIALNDAANHLQALAS